MAKNIQRGDLENLGTGIIQVRSSERCLWHLMILSQGVYEPDFGRVPVLPDEAIIHNKALCEAEIHSLDTRCAVGMQGMLYFDRKNNTVVTFESDVVSDDVVVTGNIVRFRRKGMEFRGKLEHDACLFKFKRLK